MGDTGETNDATAGSNLFCYRDFIFDKPYDPTYSWQEGGHIDVAAFHRKDVAGSGCFVRNYSGISLL